ncbi:hypothetical protein [Telluria aromaticivorans]|uniref:Uncharacterized protein n=1 Tax=Telluria aromaticivorans TaxID=2725995 RepID=A0A7Y2JZM6_9BURK|nr:hypothetical protein [Telluria aromaticivorans]NNG23826.1 hypothetical protein [Telluria aromaticivorans]
MSPIKSTIAVLFALGSASALAQNQATLTPTPSKPADSATYGPVLNPQATPAPAPTPPAAPQPSGEARPQAQEERAGQPPTSKHLEVDPSARPAPQAVQPQQGQQSQDAQKRKPPSKKGKQAVRRSVDQRIERTPRIAAPLPPPSPRAEVQPAPRPAGPSSTQVVGCVGGNCTDTSGTGYNAAGPGNAAVSSSGQLCTRSGATMQCF